MSKIKTIFVLLVVFLSSVFLLNSIFTSILLSTFLWVELSMLRDDMYKKSSLYIKYIFSLSTILIFAIIVVFDLYFLTEKNKLSFSYQAIIFLGFILTTINLGLWVIIKLIKANGLNVSKGNKFYHFDNGSISSKQVDVNPASGLPMHNSIDSVGNVIGQNANDFSNR